MVDRHHPLCGQHLNGKILAIPAGRGRDIPSLENLLRRLMSMSWENPCEHEQNKPRKKNEKEEVNDMISIRTYQRKFG